MTDSRNLAAKNLRIYSKLFFDDEQKVSLYYDEATNNFIMCNTKTNGQCSVISQTASIQGSNFLQLCAKGDYGAQGSQLYAQGDKSCRYEPYIDPPPKSEDLCGKVKVLEDKIMDLEKIILNLKNKMSSVILNFEDDLEIINTK